MDFPAILASLTTNPARRFGFGDRSGRVAAGMDGDLVVLDVAFEIEKGVRKLRRISALALLPDSTARPVTGRPAAISRVTPSSGCAPTGWLT